MTIHLDELLDCDDKNIRISKEALIEIEPTSLEAIELCASTIERLARKFGEVSKYDHHHQEIENWATKIGLKGNQALYFLKDAVLIGACSSNDPTTMARKNLHNATAILARMHLALRLGRDFLFGVTDLLRLRITSALGILRVQAESIGQLNLLRAHPELGEDWFTTADEDKGRQFHNKWHRQVVTAIRNLGLYDDYSRASNMSLHTRASGTAYGILLGSKDKNKSGEIRLIYQETDDPRILFFWFGVFLKFYRKALQHAHDLFPELTDADIKDASVQDFIEKEKIIWNKSLEVHQSLRKTGLTKVLGGERR